MHIPSCNLNSTISCHNVKQVITVIRQTGKLAAANLFRLQDNIMTKSV